MSKRNRRHRPHPPQETPPAAIPAAAPETAARKTAGKFRNAAMGVLLSAAALGAGYAVWRAEKIDAEPTATAVPENVPAKTAAPAAPAETREAAVTRIMAELRAFRHPDMEGLRVVTAPEGARRIILFIPQLHSLNLPPPADGKTADEKTLAMADEVIAFQRRLENVASALTARYGRLVFAPEGVSPQDVAPLTDRYGGHGRASKAYLEAALDFAVRARPFLRGYEGFRRDAKTAGTFVPEIPEVVAMETGNLRQMELRWRGMVDGATISGIARFASAWALRGAIQDPEFQGALGRAKAFLDDAVLYCEGAWFPLLAEGKIGVGATETDLVGRGVAQKGLVNDSAAFQQAAAPFEAGAVKLAENACDQWDVPLVIFGFGAGHRISDKVDRLTALVIWPVSSNRYVAEIDGPPAAARPAPTAP